MAVSEAQFAEWVQRHYRAVYRRCYYLLGDADEADDAAQETFLRAYLARERYDPARALRPWLLTIATRHCLDRLRRRSRRPATRWDDLQTLPAAPARAEDALVEDEEHERVRQAVATLPPMERALIVLHYWEDLPYEAIAAQTGLSVSAVKSRLYRARQRLARILEES